MIRTGPGALGTHLSVALLVLWIGALRWDPTPTPEADVSVQLLGCVDVRASDGACVVREGEDVDVWVRGPYGGTWSVEDDGQSVLQSVTPVCLEWEIGSNEVCLRDDGHRLRIRHGRTEADAERATAGATPGEAPTPPRHWTLTFHGGEASRARKDVPFVLQDEAERARGAHAEHLRAEWRTHFDRGDTAGALTSSRTSIAMAPALGRPGTECRDRVRMLHLLALHPDPKNEGPALAASLDALAVPCRAAGFEPAYYIAEYAFWKGDLVTASRRVDEALLWTARRTLDADTINARSLKGLIEHALGRSGSAAKLLEELVAPSAVTQDYAAEWAIALQDLGWILADQPGEDPSAGLHRAAEALQKALTLVPTKDVEGRISVLVDLSLAFSAAGARAPAEHALIEAVRLGEPMEDFTRVELVWACAEVALSQGRLDLARSLFTTLGERAEGFRDLAWESAHGLARVLEAEGRREEAAQAYADCVASIDEASLSLPLGVGRETFVGRFDRAAGRHVALFLHDDPSRAAELARSHRNRFLSRLRWTDWSSAQDDPGRAALGGALSDYRRARDERYVPAADALRSLERTLRELGMPLGAPSTTPPRRAPGELTLLYSPVPGGWAGFAIDDTGTHAVRLGRLPDTTDPAHRGTVLLEPFDEALARARSVRILAQGALDSLPIHLQDWRGAPLLESRPVAYGIDMAPPATSRGPALHMQRRALVVQDPTGTLSGADTEVDAAVNALRADPTLEVTVLRGAEATRARIRAELSDPAIVLFHFAGHADGGGFDGIQGALVLREEERLSIGEVLSLPRVPEVVILSACRAATTGRGAQLASLGLAQAFLLSGAHVVLAPVVSVDDQKTKSLLLALYQELRGNPAVWDVPRAFQTVAARRPVDEWSAFRVFVR